MTQAIWRPCYVTREEVRRAVDVKHSAYNNEQVDRQIVFGSEAVDDLCKRQFFPEDKQQQIYFDWPGFQYTYPWKLYLNRWELAVSPPISLKSGPITIPPTAYFCKPEYGPPFRWIELDRSQNYSFGNSSTPQRDILLTGTFGYWNKQQSAGSLSSAMSDTTGTNVLVPNSATPGVGDLIFVDSERMIVQDRTMIDTGVTGTGLATASAADIQLTVPDTTQFYVGESLRFDMERVLVQERFSSTILLVKRAWDGTVLAQHPNSVHLWAGRQLTVIRGAVGTIASTHASNTPMTQLVVPGLVKELALAESVVGLTQEPSAYSGGISAVPRAALRTAGQVNEPLPGQGLPDLRARTCTAYGRIARSRVI